MDEHGTTFPASVVTADGPTPLVLLGAEPPRVTVTLEVVKPLVDALLHYGCHDEACVGEDDACTCGLVPIANAAVATVLAMETAEAEAPAALQRAAESVERGDGGG